MQRKFFLLLVFFVGFLSVFKALSGDSIRVSLLTVMPRSNEVYTIYGHTAIRVHDSSRNMDVVFNYGSFSFHEPGFIYHFVKGDADYYLSWDEYNDFQRVYSRGNSTVIEQVLNIPEKDKEGMIQMFRINLLPENLKYRYNFLFDNCATRPRDIIEKYCGGTLIYPDQQTEVTFRDLIHSCTDPYPWMTFGIDLIIGCGADSLIGLRQEMFLPVKLMNALDGAKVVNDSLSYPLLTSSKEIISSHKNDSQPSSWSSPMKLGIVLLIHSLVFAVCGWIWKREFRFFFGLIFLQAGLAGCIVAFVSLISDQPCTWPNWNLLWLHPLHLIAFTGFFFKKSYSFIRGYHGSNFVLLSLLLLGWHWVPQELNLACIPYILCLWLGSGYRLISKKQKV